MLYVAIRFISLVVAIAARALMCEKTIADYYIRSNPAVEGDYTCIYHKKKDGRISNLGRGCVALSALGWMRFCRMRLDETDIALPYICTERPLVEGVIDE
jgi:hypothetical protein